MLPDRIHSSVRRVVIRKPLRTKKTSTPRKPPRMRPRWYDMTARIDTPRSPSSEGRYPSENGTTGGAGGGAGCPGASGLGAEVKRSVHPERNRENHLVRHGQHDARPMKRHPEAISLRLDVDLRDANRKVRPPRDEEDGVPDIHRLILGRGGRSTRGQCRLLPLDGVGDRLLHRLLDLQVARYAQQRRIPEKGDHDEPDEAVDQRPQSHGHLS